MKEAREIMLRPIVITGFMGAGKTTVARALAQRLNCHAVDLDEFIKARHGRTAQQIIDEDGETAFREIETNALREVLISSHNISASIIDGNSTCVIALGGGAWTLERNRALVATHNCLVVWLDAPFELCWKRITREDANLNSRPFARNIESAQRRFDERRGFYQLATLQIKIEARDTVDTVAQHIIELYRHTQ